MFCGLSVKGTKRTFRVVNQNPSKVITETLKLRDGENAFPLKFNKTSLLLPRLPPALNSPLFWFNALHSNRKLCAYKRFFRDESHSVAFSGTKLNLDEPEHQKQSHSFRNELIKVLAKFSSNKIIYSNAAIAARALATTWAWQPNYSS